MTTTQTHAALLAKLQPAQEPAQAGELPPLPEPAAWRTSDEWPMCYQYTHEEPDEERISWAARYGRKHETVFTADQMHAYARAALAARKPLTEEQRSKVFRDAETRMVYDLINLSWRNAVVDEVERAHGINGLEVKP